MIDEKQKISFAPIGWFAPSDITAQRIIVHRNVSKAKQPKMCPVYAFPSQVNFIWPTLNEVKELERKYIKGQEPNCVDFAVNLITLVMKKNKMFI